MRSFVSEQNTQESIGIAIGQCIQGVAHGNYAITAFTIIFGLFLLLPFATYVVALRFRR